MKRKIYLIYGLYIIVISIFLISGTSSASDSILLDVYFVDFDMLRLVSVDFECGEKTLQKQAEAVIDELILGRDENPKIRRMIPDIKNCLKVKVIQDCAYVDISKKSIEYFPDGRVAEELVVYQIVNSLTDIDGIFKVKFTIDGKVSKSFKGFIDMRETFIPDYYV